MNPRKLLGIVAAIVLAAVGTTLLVAYVDNAEERALDGEDLIEVYRVTDTIGAGTTAEDLGGRVTTEQVPRKIVPSDAVADLAELSGLVAQIDLVPGEQLLRSRFVAPLTLQREAGRIADIPAGLQEITLSLEPERAGGASLLPGDTVAVYASFDPFDISTEVPVELDDGTVVPPNGRTPNTTQTLLHGVLVTNVQLADVPEVDKIETVGDEDSREVRLAPTGNLLVSLALDTFDGERMIFAAEFGTIWLALEPATADTGPSLIQNRGTVYIDRTDPRLRIALEARTVAEETPAKGDDNG